MDPQNWSGGDEILAVRDELESMRSEGRRAAKSRARELEATRIDGELKLMEAAHSNAVRILRLKCEVVEAKCQLMKINHRKSKLRKGLEELPPEIVRSVIAKVLSDSSHLRGVPSPALKAPPQQSSGAAFAAENTIACLNASLDASPPGVACPDASQDAGPASIASSDASQDAGPASIACSDASPDASPHRIACRDASQDAGPAPIACSEASVASSNEASTFHCPICLVEQGMEDVFLVDSCGHRLCRDCARQMILKALRSGGIPVGCPSCQSEPCPKCPENGNQPGPSRQQKRCTLSQGDVETVLTEEEFIRFLSATLNESVNTSGGCLIRCPDGECCGVLEIPDDRVNFVCPVCVKLWCRNCKVEWHENITCEEFQMTRVLKEDQGMNQMMEEGRIKRCPRCQNFGMKEESEECNAIICQSCKCSFCWLCLKDLSDYDESHAHFAEAGECFGKCFYGLPGHESIM